MSLTKLLKWKDSVHGCGVLTGADENQEWMLINWWDHYTKTNTHPVTFINFGMTKSARLWCEKRGTVFDFQIPASLLAQKEDIPPITAKFWDRIYSGNVWQARQAWFSKPFTLIQTPYEKSIWVDLDCEIRQPLDELFPLLDTQIGFAISPTTASFQKFSRIMGLHQLDEKTYNTGVVAFKYHSPVMQKWVENTYKRNKEFMGDENVLNRTIHEEKFVIIELPLSYNWPFFLGEDPDVKVVHFCANQGKQTLLKNS